MRDALSTAELGAFGIRPADEGMHAADPDDPSWNESLFYDWLDGEGRVAGHIRLGVLPNQGRCWLWIFLYQDGEWLVVEEPRLPASALSGDGFDYEGYGLRFHRVIEEPLRKSVIRASGVGRVVKGARAGRLLPFEVEVETIAAGPAHSVGDRDVDGHTSERYESNRFEQPVRASFTQRVGDATHRVEDGHGERDHSWGPRFWNMEWHFLVVGDGARRLLAARITLDEDSELSIGYLLSSDGSVANVEDAVFELTYDDDLDRAFGGRVLARIEGDRELAGTIECLTAIDIDASHVFEPPQPSVYRRAVVRFTPNDGGPASVGYLEVNRFPGGIRDEAP